MKFFQTATNGIECPLKSNRKITAHDGAISSPLSTSSNQRFTNNSIFAVGTFDGNLEFFPMKNSNEEEWSLTPIREIKAHDGAITSLQWSHDDSTLGTGGIDGEVKVWSRAGHLRIKLASFEKAVNALAWGPTSESIIIANGDQLSLAQLNGRCKSISGTWGSSIILAVDWNATNGLIVSGSEDGHYRISTLDGVLLYSSQQQIHPITSIAWILNNNSYFAVGGFGYISLCDSEGIIHDQIQCSEASSVIQMSQRQDSSQLVGECSNGETMVLSLVGTKKFYGEVSVELLSTTTLKVSYLTSVEHLSSQMIHIPASEMILNFDVSFGKMAVLTKFKCFLYDLNQLDLPVTIDFQEDTMYRIVLGRSYVASIGWNGIRVYSYHGKFLSSPNYQFTSSGQICSDSITIGENLLAIIDDSNQKIIRLFRCDNGESLDIKIGRILHNVTLKQIYLSSRRTNMNEQYLLMIDENEDLFIRPITAQQYALEDNYESFKLGTHVKSAGWDEKGSTVCCLEESKAIFFYFPAAPFVDLDLLRDTKESVDLGGESTKCRRVETISSNRAVVTIQNESVVHLPISEDYSLLQDYASEGAWKKCIRLCRFQNNLKLWAVLALEATRMDELGALETALSTIKAVEKLEHVRFIKNLPEGERKNAELSLYKRKPNEAVSILVDAQPPLTYDAVMIRIQMFQWEQALHLAKGKGGDDRLLDIVLWHRAQYLQRLNQKEELAEFRSLRIERQIPSSKADIEALKLQFRAVEIQQNA